MYPAQLSGGQQQRVGVARALAADPPVLLMDEPFGAVDPIVRAQLQREFLRLQRDLAKTVVFVTHDVDEAILLGTRIAVMQTGGRIAQIGPPAELLANPASEFVRRLPRSARASCTTTAAPPAGTASTPCSATLRSARTSLRPPMGAGRTVMFAHRSGDRGVCDRRCAVLERAAARRQLGRHLVLHAATPSLHRDRGRRSGTFVSFPLAYLSVRRPATYPVILSVTNVDLRHPVDRPVRAAGAGARLHQRQADHRRDGAVHARDPRAQHRRGDPRRAADRWSPAADGDGLPTARPLRRRRAAARPARHRRRTAPGDGEHRVADQRRRAHRPRRARPAVRRRPRRDGSPTSCGPGSSPSSCWPSCSTRCSCSSGAGRRRGRGNRAAGSRSCRSCSRTPWAN